ncbi:MAG: hypothetical protein H6R17_2681 [Proteobacteria bacterium]|nr:hypothetical protein [Pseudomonadota bacterium]
MSKPAAYRPSNKVVSLNGRGRDRSPGLRILGECREQLLEHLSRWLHDVATGISEELFVLADATRDRQEQTRYLDLRAAIEKDWASLLETFRHDLVAEAELCQNQANPPVGGSEQPLELPDFHGLELVDDEDLAKHIVIREFAAQLGESCDAELYPLNRRVAVLLGQDEAAGNANPLAPPVVCRALSNACATLVADGQTQLLLLRRLERHLHLALPPIYRQLNAALIERGILPDFKRSYQRSTAPPVPAAQPSGGATASATALTDQGILATLQRLALARVGHTAVPATATGATPDTAGIDQLLLASLDELQHAPAGSIINQVRQVRDSPNAQQVGGLAAVTIDIVAMLFDFIFDDAHIPVAVKALLSRLQIPVLKVAMQNPGFFADRQHPTRRFLGSISGISIRWGGSVAQSDPFYRKLAELVERIQAEFQSDVEIFGTALAELESFVGERQNEEDRTALTAANVVNLREQQNASWERAQRALETARSAGALPALIDDFLAEHWLGVLQAGALGDDDNAWQAAVQTMNDLVWSVAPKTRPEDRLKLISLLPGLLARLNQGLASVNTGAEQSSAFFDRLLPYHAAALKGETPAPPIPAHDEEPNVAALFTPAAEGDLVMTRSIDDGVEVEEVMLVGARPIWRADDREIHRQVSELKRGDWVEFGSEDAGKRERLNWISPQRGILLFSNHQSAKAISITPDALARQIRDGAARIVRQEEIFERALSGALESVNAA